MAETINIREAVLDTLTDLERTGKPSHLAVRQTLMRLQFAPRQDRAFYTLLCEGTIEQKLYLDYILDQFSRTKMKKCKPLIRSLLRMSAYQIIFTETRDAAACNEAVKLAKKRGFYNLSGFVNGVLRTLIRQKDQLPLPDRRKEPDTFLSVRYSMPLWIVEKLSSQYGAADSERMLQSFLKAKPVTIRTSMLNTDPAALREELTKEGIEVSESAYFPWAFSITGYDRLEKIGAFRRGHFTVQDISSMLPVAVSDLTEGDTVIDVCAAPGGKTFHAADAVGKQGKVIARDLTELKTDLIRENNARLLYDHIEIQEWDACIPDEDLYQTADLVIADLPCSGLGIMGRKNDIKYHITKERIAELIALQRKILSVVWRYVKPGGQLIFSTCTICEEENEENVKWILEHTPLIPASIEEKLPYALRRRTGPRGYITVLPGIDPGDGFFVSKFIRSPDEDDRNQD